MKYPDYPLIKQLEERFTDKKPSRLELRIMKSETSKVLKKYGTPKLYNMNSYQHLYNRGVNKENIYWDNKDYKYFLRKMKEYKEKYLIRIICYCLLPNHFHLFVKQLSNDFTIGKFISDLANSYTKGTNKKYNRTGVLFEGRTKSRIVADENYFVWLCKYILNNPVNARLVINPDEWEYSSAKEYYNADDSTQTYTREILSRFSSPKEFNLFIRNQKAKFDYAIFF